MKNTFVCRPISKPYPAILKALPSGQTIACYLFAALMLVAVYNKLTKPAPAAPVFIQTVKN
jgi:hypothetical protein